MNVLHSRTRERNLMMSEKEWNKCSQQTRTWLSPSLVTGLFSYQIWHKPRKWKWAETCPKAHDFSLFLNAFKNEKSHFNHDHSEPDIFKARCQQNDLYMIILDNVLWLALQSRVAWSQKNVQPKINSKPSQKELKLVQFFLTSNHRWIPLKTWSNHERGQEYSYFKMDPKAP